MHTILLVEDDLEIREELQILLQNRGYEVKSISDFQEVEKQILTIAPDLILLDINLPNKNGYEICRKVRMQSKVPIIFVTSRNSSLDELNGLMLGADDYVEKPYDIPILLARIQGVLNRVYQGKKDEVNLSYQNITLNLLESTVSANGKTVELTKNELKILSYLFQHPKQIVSRAEIIDYLWDNQMYIDDNTLSVNMTRIREKLAQIEIENLIETRRGQGYKI